MPVSFNYIPSDVKAPLFYAEVDNSAANTASSTNRSLLIGQMAAYGLAEAGIPVAVASASVANRLFGRGSQLARMVTAYRKNDPSGVLYAVPLSDPEGAAATISVKVSGSASVAGAVYLYVGNTRVAVQVAAGAKAADVASGIASAINANADLPVTASASSGQSIATIMAKNAGLAGNDIRVELNRSGAVSGEELPAGISVEIGKIAGSDITPGEMLTGGAGSPDLAKAFEAVGEEAFEFIGTPYSDAAALDACKEEMSDASGRWSPTRQLYGHVYTARRGTSSDLSSYGKARNDQHMTIFAIEPTAPNDVAEIVGAALGRIALFITNDPARPTQTGILQGIGLTPLQGRFRLPDKQILLSSGIATLYCASDYTRIERAVTTYQRNSFGDSDNSYLDSETLHTLSYVIRNLRTRITSKYARHKLADDGTRFGAGQAVVTPSIIRAEIIAAYRQLEYRAIVENGDLFAENLIVERDSTDVNRVNVLFPPDLVNQLRVFAVLAQFRLQYDSNTEE